MIQKEDPPHPVPSIQPIVTFIIPFLLIWVKAIRRIPLSAFHHLYNLFP